jgi:hypothetical protein
MEAEKSKRFCCHIDCSTSVSSLLLLVNVLNNPIFTLELIIQIVGIVEPIITEYSFPENFKEAIFIFVILKNGENP